MERFRGSGRCPVTRIPPDRINIGFIGNVKGRDISVADAVPSEGRHIDKALNEIGQAVKAFTSCQRKTIDPGEIDPAE